jgi:hypothetical protein
LLHFHRFLPNVESKVCYITVNYSFRKKISEKYISLLERWRGLFPVILILKSYEAPSSKCVTVKISVGISGGTHAITWQFSWSVQPVETNEEASVFKVIHGRFIYIVLFKTYIQINSTLPKRCTVRSVVRYLKILNTAVTLRVFRSGSWERFQKLRPNKNVTLFSSVFPRNRNRAFYIVILCTLPLQTSFSVSDMKKVSTNPHSHPMGIK